MTTNTPATQGTSPITTKQVEEEKLFDFLPQMFGKYYMLGESVVYSTMRELCVGYCGGQWLYFDLSNGGHFMGLDSETDFEVMADSNLKCNTCNQVRFADVITSFVLVLSTTSA